MSIYGISDLHLSFGTDKPMDIFRGWNNHTERLFANWNRLVKEDDTVVLPGDLSWALKLEETKKDFEFLKTLKGKKILIKGNHDLWWSTAKKIHTFFENENITDCEILFNSSVVVTVMPLRVPEVGFTIIREAKRCCLEKPADLKHQLNRH